MESSAPRNWPLRFSWISTRKHPRTSPSPRRELDEGRWRGGAATSPGDHCERRAALSQAGLSRPDRCLGEGHIRIDSEFNDSDQAHAQAIRAVGQFARPFDTDQDG